jgi:predicted nucleic acid-binding protein
MGGRDFFVDTSGIYALLVARDPVHAKAVAVLKAAAAAGRGAVLTDYVLNEAATLLMARKVPHLAEALFAMVDRSKALRLVFVGADRFGKAREIFLKRIGQGHSFADCTSFVVMRDLGLADALTTDRHFAAAGFRPLLAS